LLVAFVAPVVAMLVTFVGPPFAAPGLRFTAVAATVGCPVGGVRALHVGTVDLQAACHGESPCGGRSAAMATSSRRARRRRARWIESHFATPAAIIDNGSIAAARAM